MLSVDLVVISLSVKTSACSFSTPQPVESAATKEVVAASKDLTDMRLIKYIKMSHGDVMSCDTSGL